MRYVDFRDSIEKNLRKHPDGLTWRQLKERGRLPYQNPCQTWVRQLEEDIGLFRVQGSGRALIWKVPAGHRSSNKERRQTKRCPSKKRTSS